MRKTTYEAQDFFIIRCPINSYNKDILSMDDGQVIDRLKNDHAFRESIAVASLDLYEALVRAEKNDNFTQELMLSVKKYLSRSSTRTSPYGLYCGVSEGRFEEQDDIALSSRDAYRKVCYVDMEWIMHLIRMLEANENILMNTRVVRNENCYISGDKLKYHSASGYGLEQGHFNTTEILFNSLMKYIWEHSAEFIAFGELAQSVAGHFDIPIVEVFNYLSTLSRKEILLTDIRECLSSKGYFDMLIDKLDGYDLDEDNSALLEMLKSIKGDITKYTRKPLGQGIEGYTKLVSNMRELIHTKNYLNVSLGRKIDKNQINSAIKDDISQFMEFLSKIQTIQETNEVAAFRRRFVDKYGEYTEVPFLEVIDYDTGIGLPFGNEVEAVEEGRTLRNYLDDRVDRALLSKQSTVVLKDSDIPFMSEEGRPIIQSPSFEMFLSVAYTNDDYNLYVGNNMFSNKIGCSLNRFADLFSDEMKASIEACYDWDETATKNHYSIINVVELNRVARSLNICMDCGNYRRNLYINTVGGEGETISLNDIYIGYSKDYGRLYLKSKSLGEVVFFTSDSMLKLQLSNKAARMLREISYAYDSNPCETLYHFRNLDRRYIPEFRYGKFIINTETWRFRKSDFANLADFAGFKKQFAKYQQEWNIPEYVNLANFDERLIVSLHDDTCLGLLQKELRQKGVIMLSKVAEGIDWLTDDEGNKFVSEIVVSVLLKDKLDGQPLSDINTAIPTLSPVHENRMAEGIFTCERKLILAIGNWVYFKIYIDPAKFDIIVANYLDHLLKAVDGYVNKYFFIKYSDSEGFHIRLRFELADREHTGKVVGSFSEWFGKLKGAGVGKMFSIDIYERELERYGGPLTIEAAEDFFCVDSRVVKRLLEIKANTSLNDMEAGMFFVYQVLDVLIGDRKKEETYLNSIVKSSDFRSEFKEIKNDAVGLIINGRLSIDDDELNYLIKERAAELSRFKQRIDETDRLGKLANGKADIVRSVCHMFCNRFNGDMEFEHMLISFIRHSVHVINEREKHIAPRQIKE